MDINKEKLAKEIGQRVHDERLDLELSEARLSDYLEVPESYIREIESGETMPSTEHLFQMCCIFGKTLDYMVKGVVPEEGNADAAYYKEQQFKFLISHMSPEHQEYIKGRLKYYYDLEYAENGKTKQK